MAEQKKKGYWLQLLLTAILIGGGVMFFMQTRKSKQTLYYTYFYDIKGLQSSSPVQINGVRVGKISDIELIGDKLKIILAVNKDITITEGTTASLANGGTAGEKIIMLKPGALRRPLEEYAIIPSTYDTSVLPLSARITPMIQSAKALLNSADVGLRGMTYIINGGLTRQSAEMLISIDAQTQKLKSTSEKINAKGGEIAKNIHATAASTQDIARNMADTRQSINEFEKSSDKLAKTPITDNLKKLGNNISALGKTFRKISSVDSGMGKALTTKDAYNKAATSLDSTNRGLKKFYKRANSVK
jgi:phospholipid/cholesterol/gamma-HCH transport system substrate-binding protein